MKYQKSMLKIYEKLVKWPTKEFIIEDIIKEAEVGRTSGFKAIKWLESNNLIKIKTKGKQKYMKLLINDVALNFKFFLNSVELKELSKEILSQINLFVYLTYHNKIESILLFGSAAKFIKHPNDIDLVIIYKKKNEYLINQLKAARKLIENISDTTINLHFKNNPHYAELLKEIVVYNKSYYSVFFKENDKSIRMKIQYKEALYDLDSIINNINDNGLLPELTQRLIINLAYCYCMAEEKETQTKEETINIFMKKYKNRMKKFGKVDNIGKFNILRGITNEIGQKIFT